MVRLNASFPGQAACESRLVTVRQGSVSNLLSEAVGISWKTRNGCSLLPGLPAIESTLKGCESAVQGLVYVFTFFERPIPVGAFPASAQVLG